MFCVIVGDIIRSRSLNTDSREQVTAYFEGILEQINKKYQDNIMTNFGIVRGDAFEGVLFSQQDIPGIVQDIIKLFWRKLQIKVRICAVVDELSTINTNRDKADGPAFHKAIQEIDRMRANKSDHWFQVSIITNTIVQPLIDSILRFLATLTEDWTEKQKEIVWAMSDYSNLQILVSRNMGVSTPTVSKQLKSANYEVYSKAWFGLEEYFVASEDALVKDSNGKTMYPAYYSMGLYKNKRKDYYEAIEYFNESIDRAKIEIGEKDSRLTPLYNGLARTYLEILSGDENSGESRILQGSNIIYSAAYDASGEYLASGSLDGTITIWNLKNGKSHTLEGHSAGVRSVVYSPDGKYLASGSNDKTIRIWDIVSGESLVLEGHTDKVGSVAFSPNGRYLASGSNDKTVRIWDLKSNIIQVLHVLSGHRGSIESVAFSIDGKHLASGSYDGSVRIWNTESGECCYHISNSHSSRIFSVAFSPDGRSMAGGYLDKAIRIWDLKNMECHVLEGHLSWIFSVAFSPDGRYLASSSRDKTVRIWNLQSGECRVLSGHSDWVYSIVYSPDGKHLASSSVDKTVRIWNLESLDRSQIAAKALNVIESSLSCQEDMPHTTIEYAQTMNLKGQYYLAIQQYNDAIDCFTTAERIIIDIYGINHPLLQNYYNNAALAYKEKGEYKRAKEYYEKSIQIAKKNIELDPLSYADTLYEIGLCYERIQQYSKAKNYINESIATLSSFFTEKNEYAFERKAALERITKKMHTVTN